LADLAGAVELSYSGWKPRTRSQTTYSEILAT